MDATSAVKKVTLLVSVRTNQSTTVVAKVVIVTNANSQATLHANVQTTKSRIEVVTNVSAEMTIRLLSEEARMKAGTRISLTSADKMFRDNNNRTVGMPIKDQTVAGTSEVVHATN